MEEYHMVKKIFLSLLFSTFIIAFICYIYFGKGFKADGITLKPNVKENTVDGILYRTETGHNLTFTYPIIDLEADEGDWEQVGFYSESGFGFTKGFENDEPYFIMRSVRFADIFNNTDVKMAEYTIYNAKARFAVGRDSSHYTFPLEQESKMITMNAGYSDDIDEYYDTKGLYIEMPQEMMYTDNIYNNYKQSMADERMYFCNELKKAIIGIYEYHSNGSRKQEYYRIEPISETLYTTYTIYKLTGGIVNGKEVFDE